MTDVLPANFTISVAAKHEIENLRRQWNEQSPDPAAVLMVGWGLFRFNSGQQAENVVVSLYGESQLAQVAHGIQEVSGTKLVFFTTPEYHHKFEGKVLDFAADQGFFLRAV